jgi:hypothetical protein
MKLDDVEQHLPNRPNFGLVFGLAGAAILVFFVLALIFLHFDGSHLTFRHHYSHPTSRLTSPPALRAPESSRLA